MAFLKSLLDSLLYLESSYLSCRLTQAGFSLENHRDQAVLCVSLRWCRYILGAKAELQERKHSYIVFFKALFGSNLLTSQWLTLVTKSQNQNMDKSEDTSRCENGDQF